MAYTTTSSVDYAKTAYDMLLYFALRPELYYDQIADIKPTNQSMPGASVVFTITNDLAIASTALTESVDITPVAMSDSQVTVALSEYGNGTLTTAALRGESFVSVDEAQANVVGYNAGVSIDEIVKGVVQAGNNVNYAAGATGVFPGARNQITPSDTLRAFDVRLNVARLRENNVPGFGGFYVAYIHPDVSFDLWQESGNQALNAPHDYSQPDEIWRGEIGAFAGARFVETPRAPLFADAGSSTTDTDVYATLFVGRQSLAKVWSLKDGNGPVPKIVFGPITDFLRRFQPLGWYWLGGYSIFRQASLWRCESASSIGLNASAGSNDPTIDI